MGLGEAAAASNELGVGSVGSRETQSWSGEGLVNAVKLNTDGPGQAWRGSAALISPLQRLLVPTQLTMIEKTKATMLIGYAGQKHETMESHR